LAFQLKRRGRDSLTSQWEDPDLFQIAKGKSECNLFSQLYLIDCSAFHRQTIYVPPYLMFFLVVLALNRYMTCTSLIFPLLVRTQLQNRISRIKLCRDILGSFRFDSYCFLIVYIGCVLFLLLAYQSHNIRDLFPRIGSAYFLIYSMYVYI